MNVADALAELFSAPREEFTGLRDAWVKRAKAAQQTDVADQLRALRKPTVAAWLVNQVSREYPDDVSALISVGDELREAHHSLAGDRLRSLSRQRSELSQTLTRRARAVAETAGVSFSDSAVDQVETTWTTAAADARAAEVLRAGHLSAALTPDSEQDWLAVAVSAAPAAASAAAPPVAPAPVPVVDRGALREARRELQQAERALDQARRAQENADREAEAAAVGARKLREELAELEARVADADSEERDSKASAADAAKATTAAERAVRSASRKVAKLED